MLFQNPAAASLCYIVRRKEEETAVLITVLKYNLKSIAKLLRKRVVFHSHTKMVVFWGKSKDSH